MAKIVKLKWTELQKELAAKAAEGKTFDELVQGGYTKSLVSKVLNAIKSGQKPPEEAELEPENGEPENGEPKPKAAKPKTAKPKAPSKCGEHAI